MEPPAESHLGLLLMSSEDLVRIPLSSARQGHSHFSKALKAMHIIPQIEDTSWTPAKEMQCPKPHPSLIMRPPPPCAGKPRRVRRELLSPDSSAGASLLPSTLPLIPLRVRVKIVNDIFEKRNSSLVAKDDGKKVITGAIERNGPGPTRSQSLRQKGKQTGSRIHPRRGLPQPTARPSCGPVVT